MVEFVESLLVVAGLILIVAAAFLVNTILGVLAAGIGLLVFGKGWL